MNVNRNFMPELFYSLDQNMTLDKIYRAKERGVPIIAYVVRWNAQEQCAVVNLGNNFKGIIPLNEFSIYPVVRPNGHIAPSLYFHIGRNICVCVKEISDTLIVLSRRQSMLRAFGFFQQSEHDIVTCSIQSIEDYGVFVDVGCGVNGMIKTENLCIARVNNPSDIGLRSRQFINAQITDINATRYQISLSHKTLFKNESYLLNPGDIVKVIALSPVNNLKDGYFVFLSPNTAAIMDVPVDCTIPYGSKVLAIVKNPSLKHPDKVRLRFLSF